MLCEIEKQKLKLLFKPPGCYKTKYPTLHRIYHVPALSRKAHKLLHTLDEFYFVIENTILFAGMSLLCLWVCSVKSYKSHDFFVLFFVTLQSTFVQWSTKQWLFYTMFFLRSVWRDNRNNSSQPSKIFLTILWFSLTVNVSRVEVWY